MRVASFGLRVFRFRIWDLGFGIEKMAPVSDSYRHCCRARTRPFYKSKIILLKITNPQSQIPNSLTLNLEP
jgi:hypothetical protein